MIQSVSLVSELALYYIGLHNHHSNILGKLQILVWTGVFSVVAVVFQCLGGGALTHFIAELCLERAVSVKNSLAQLRQRWLPLLSVTALEYCLLFLSLFTLVIPVIVFSFMYGQFNILIVLQWFPVFVLALSPFIYLTMIFLLLPQAVMLEAKNGLAAMKRSWEIVCHNPKLGFMQRGETRLSLLLLAILPVHLLLIVATYLPQINAGIGEILRGNYDLIAMKTPLAVKIYSNLLTFLTDSLVFPAYLIACTVFYYDVRIRKETKLASPGTEI